MNLFCFESRKWMRRSRNFIKHIDDQEGEIIDKK